MNRVTKSNNFLLLSATKKQVAKQQALECIPLVIEPPKNLFIE